MSYYIQEINSARDIIGDMNKNHEGIRTGYELLDRSGTFLRQGEISILFGGPLMGKTGFAVNLAVNLLGAGRKVLYLTFDRSEKEIACWAADIAEDTKLLKNLDIMYVISPGKVIRDVMRSVSYSENEYDLIIIDDVNKLGEEHIQWLYGLFSESAMLLLYRVPPEKQMQLKKAPGGESFGEYVYATASISREDYSNQDGERRTGKMDFRSLAGDYSKWIVSLHVDYDTFKIRDGDIIDDGERNPVLVAEEE